MKKQRRRKSTTTSTVSLSSSLKLISTPSVVTEELLPPLCYEQRYCYQEYSPFDGFKGVRWSPDGTCLLSSLHRSCFVFEPCVNNNNLLSKAVSIHEAEPIYNYSWYPLMDSKQPESCCFAALSKNTPVHLWDAYESNKLRASYLLECAQGEPVWALSMELTHSHVFAGLDSFIYIWDITRPGLPMERHKTKDQGISGLVSCFDFPKDDEESHLLCAVGFYSGYVVAYDREMTVVFRTRVFPGGISQVLFVGANQLWVGGRRSREIICLDLRTGGELHRIPRLCGNNQRMEFDCQYGTTMAFGSSLGVVHLWDIQTQRERAALMSTNNSVVNSVRFRPNGVELAVATGCRRKPVLVFDHDSSSDDVDDDESPPETSVSIWKKVGGEGGIM